MKKLLFYVLLIPIFLIANIGISKAAEEAKAPALQPVPEISKEDFAKATGIYFNRCGGCHGTLRKGATGKSLMPDKTLTKTVAKLAGIIYDGTEGGMPGWGTTGVLSKEESELLAKFIQHEPVAPPEWNMKDMKATWKLIVPPDKRPTAPAHKRNIENFFAVILRDAGQIGIIDGDTKEIVTVVNSGFAVHTLRYSYSGRYLYTIGRDAKATMVDLWMNPPQTVAEVKTGIEARSIDSSKYKGFYDKYAVVGNYWPPSYVILDGQTLEPLKIVSTRGYTYDTNEYHPELRVASIVASHHAPEWVLNIKEAGITLLVDYSKLSEGTITETRIDAERFLHDGGWDKTKRYFLVAANMRDKVVVIDTKDRKRVAVVETGVKPHPGRGANFNDPKNGPVYATPHLGEPMVALIGTAPEGKYKGNAWKVVRKLKTAGEGGLFIKTHPRSNNLWVDHTLAKSEDAYRSVSIFNIKDLDAPPKIIKLADRGRIVHMEYNKAGDEVWIALWDKKGEIIVFDDNTLKEKTRITDSRLVTPTGKFNVYNTRYDIY
ncbi:MAG: nitrite reductase [Deltaproteobacteria bacterium GWC2_42_11]|nr:MAG: nitrite reductase [Deltaproteobacteria bacterium GWC2_42_11]